MTWLRFAAALCLLAPTSALAQAYQCRAPVNLGPIPAIKPDGPTRRVAIGGYTLALSWSPEFCRGARDKSAMQCSGQNGRFGFVLHGLWPEARFGAPPQWCAMAPLPSAQLIRANVCMTPVPALIAHEWLKHGSCMARRPEDYYATAARLWRQVALPDADHLSRKPDLTAGDLRDAFIEANPSWSRAQIGLLLGPGGWLREVHLCLSRGFKPVTCDSQSFGAANGAPLKIWRGL